MSEKKPEQAERLTKARIARGFKNARAAALFFGWAYHTYIQHEQGLRGLSRSAKRYAKAFRVSEGWLLTGEGTEPKMSNAPIPESVAIENELNQLLANADEAKLALYLRVLKSLDS
ncbi:XRE family transcriptional regulator [Bartonella sp. DGB1]|uniref:XRE family transcriptional regulator n=1 Tax=Bartonella sp. DGB1 TaxID=3239807 RepID=UPI0035258208